MPSGQAEVRLSGTKRVQRNTVCELEFASRRDCQDPWAEIELDFEFTDPDGARRVVPAYWSGGRTWRVRYSSPTEGSHNYRAIVRGPAGTGLDEFVGEVDVIGYDGTNPLYLHGPVTVADDGRHLAHADGTPFLWLGDTWWAGMTARFRWETTFKTLADDRAAKGFSVVQVVAGLVPEFEPFSPSMASEGGQPWLDGGVGGINPAFYAVPDLKIEYLVSKGIVPCIVGGWAYYAGLLGRERVLQHWRYLVARYAAYPVVWCIAGEVDLPAQHGGSAADYSGHPAGQVAIWEEASELVRQIDPYKRVRTVHPCPMFTYSSSEAMSSRDSFELDMLQTGHTGRNCVPATMEHLKASLAYADKPVLNGECSYEGIFDSCWQDLQRFLFWSHMLSGTAGHTYGTMAIGVLNSRDDPHMPLSRVSMHYWEDAIDWLGAVHVGVGKRILESLSWWTLRPAQEAVSPKAGPDDWFLPFAATTSDATMVVYLPGVAMMSTDAWARLDRLALDGLTPGRSYNATYINPRTGADDSSFAFTPVEACHVIESPGHWITPTGEDWVLVIRPVG